MKSISRLVRSAGQPLPALGRHTQLGPGRAGQAAARTANTWVDTGERDALGVRPRHRALSSGRSCWRRPAEARARLCEQPVRPLDGDRCRPCSGGSWGRTQHLVIAPRGQTGRPGRWRSRPRRKRGAPGSGDASLGINGWSSTRRRNRRGDDIEQVLGDVAGRRATQRSRTSPSCRSTVRRVQRSCAPCSWDGSCRSRACSRCCESCALFSCPLSLDIYGPERGRAVPGAVPGGGGRLPESVTGELQWRGGERHRPLLAGGVRRHAQPDPRRELRPGDRREPVGGDTGGGRTCDPVDAPGSRSRRRQESSPATTGPRSCESLAGAGRRRLGGVATQGARAGLRELVAGRAGRVLTSSRWCGPTPLIGLRAGQSLWTLGPDKPSRRVEDGVLDAVRGSFGYAAARL